MSPSMDDLSMASHKNRSTFGQQLIALMKRNLLIKKRNRGRTLLELLFPIYIIVIILSTKSSMKPTTSDAIPEPESLGEGTNWFDTTFSTPDFGDKTWFIVSQNNSEEIRGKIENVLKLMKYPETIEFNTTFSTSEELESHYMTHRDNVSLGIVFDLHNMSYTIRMPYNSVPNDLNSIGSTDHCRDHPFHPLIGGCDEMKYYKSGFVFVQSVVDSALINMIRSDIDQTVPKAGLFLFPKPEYTTSSEMWLSFIPTYLSWSFMPSISILTVMFVLEKERKIKEGMQMMGLKTSAYWISWILVQTILVIILSLVMALVLYFASIIERVNPIIVFILFLFFGISTIGISALISPFFKKEKAAGSFVSFITLIAGLVHLLVVFLDVSPSVYYLISLVSPVAFTLGINSIVSQTLAKNITLSNMFEDPIFSVGSAILMLVVDSILYTLLAIYLDQVIPGEYGPKQSVFFFLKKSFWFPHRSISSMEILERRDSHYEHNPDVEEITEEMKGKAVIQINCLSKVYGSGKTTVKAVNDLSFSVYESQITGLLGHNGAGKSTLINMLVGNIAPTSGTAYIYGHDIRDPNEMNALRQMFGVCLQQDILFDELNAEEHLNFFAQIKGVSKEFQKLEVNKLLNEVMLFEDRETPSKKLSGGQKRKLCVAIALIGNSKIILLDEPSSGVDPYSRRELWNLLQSYRKDRIIILSTHFMDEADLLADRKAIIVNGQLRCIGSSLFLKNRFGIGYHLTIAMKKDSDVDDINELVHSNIANSQMERFTSSEIYYILPPTETQLFPQLFEALEENISKSNSLIKSFGISMTTLEEVFLKIGEEMGTEDENTVKKDYMSNDHKLDEEVITNCNELNPNFWQSFKAFLYIRILIFVRNPMHSIPIIVLPIIMIIISYFLMRTSEVKDLKPSPLLLNPNIYSKNSSLLYKSIDEINQFVKTVEEMEVKPKRVEDFKLDSMSNCFMAVNISSLKTPIEWNFLFNDSYYHSLPILQNLMTNVYLRLQDSDSNQTLIQTYNHPFPQTDDERVLYSFDPKVYTYIILMAIMLGSIPPAIAVEVVEDREAKIKNLLRVCGLGFSGYWITTLVCHLIMFLISTLLILLIIIFVVKVEFLQESEAIASVFLLFMLFMPTSLIACYLMCHMFNKKDTARSVMPLICYLPGMIMIISVSITVPNDPKVGQVLHQIFSFVWPFYVPQGALFYMANTATINKISSLMNANIPRLSYFDWQQNITICYVSLTFHLILCSILLLIADRLKSGESLLSAIGFDVSPKRMIDMPSELEDQDVKQERNEVISYLQNRSTNETPIVLLNELQKKYSKSWKTVFKKDDNSEKTAIQNMSLLLESGHIFGLLGPNGAGKTTTIKIIICEEKQSNGLVMISGHKVKASDSDIFQLIGYCPQQDSLWKEITLKEHIKLFAAIRGIPDNQIETICQNYIESLKLNNHSDKKTEQLSGGTKRKLCYLLSILGRPKLVLLDEPSTGMDPKAKRFLWKTILSSFGPHSGRSAILTTHSMEEADTLCTRLAIMIKGVMRCIGSVQHLKNKYGAGYVLEIKFNNQTNDPKVGSELKTTIDSFFAKAVLKEEYNNRLMFDILHDSVKSIARVFAFLEDLKQNIGSIEEYNFSQKTIEQVFIEFAKQQEISE